ncbi:TPA: hypothetical protein DCW54_01845, partial [Candidatus Dependentiae bacterium]|nr:hypothetical protein [Candidatus Dependentiae bacterium]
MRKVLLQLFFMLTLLGSSLYSLCGEESQLQILPQEVQEVVTSSKTYLFIGEELTQIKSIIAQARALTEDAGTANSLDQLLSRYEQGFKTAPQELVVSALEEAESLIEKGHESFNDEQLGQISDSFAKCCKQIDDGELLISVNKNATRSPRDPQAPGGTPGLPAAEAGTLVPTNEPSKDLFVENDLTVGGNMIIQGDTHYAGNVEIDGTLTVDLATTLNSTLLVVGETTLTDTLYPITGIEAGPSGILNIGVTDDTDTLNLGTAAAVQAVNIGTGAGVTTINLGGAGDTVNVFGALNYIQVDDLQVKDKNIIINKDGVAGSADLAGINIEEDGSITGYMRTNADRSGIELKAPGRQGVVAIKPHVTTASGENFELTVEGERLITERDWEDIFVGRGAGNTTMTGTRNYGLGASTLQSLTTGTGNVGIGHAALADVWSGSNNICIGNESGNDIATGSSNIAIGSLALRTASVASFNTAVGSGALQLAENDENSAFGASALTNLGSGTQNAGIGNGALLNATTGSRNAALGYLAGSSQTTGGNNIYIGARQLGIGGEAGVIRIGTHNDADASVSTDCYIEGITGQATAATANVALIDTNSKLGTSATTSATVNTPSFTVNNSLGAATLNLQD